MEVQESIVFRCNMNLSSIVLGIDSSTQSTSAIVLNAANGKIEAEVRVNYKNDYRLKEYVLDPTTMVLPPLEPGEASQPAQMYLAALDACFSDLYKSCPNLIGKTEAINVSAQQHGQIWLSEKGVQSIYNLRSPMDNWKLTDYFADGFSSERAPIWMSSNSLKESMQIRKFVGGPNAITKISGSNSPVRFTGSVLARTASLLEEAYRNTERIHLISSFLAAVLSGDPNAPIDWGNGSGTGLMNWREKVWDQVLIDATISCGLPDSNLLSRLPPLSSPLTVIGKIAPYFTKKYGFSQDCLIIASSGDNPQTKVLASGSMLSLGTSFVIMGQGSQPVLEANAMYDGIGRPFLFGCRTNGSLTWDDLRKRSGYLSSDYQVSEKALASVTPGSITRICQPREESFPISPILDIGNELPFAENYAGVVDSSLSLVYLASRSFSGLDSESITVTGGGSSSYEVLKRIAGIWGRKVLQIKDAGAALGAAVAAACALVAKNSVENFIEVIRNRVIKPSRVVDPEDKIYNAYHRSSGYLENLQDIFLNSIAKKSDHYGK